LFVHIASERSVLATDNSDLAQAGPSPERAFRRTDLFIFEEREKVLLRQAAHAREFHASCVKI